MLHNFKLHYMYIIYIYIHNVYNYITGYFWFRDHHLEHFLVGCWTILLAHLSEGYCYFIENRISSFLNGMAVIGIDTVSDYSKAVK